MLLAQPRRHVSEETYCIVAVSPCILTLNHFSASCKKTTETQTEFHEFHAAWCKYCKEQRHEEKNRSVIMSAKTLPNTSVARWKMSVCIGGEHRLRLDQCLVLKWFILGDWEPNKQISCHCLKQRVRRIHSLGAFRMASQDKNNRLKQQAQRFCRVRPTDIATFISI